MHAASSLPRGGKTLETPGRGRTGLSVPQRNPFNALCMHPPAHSGGRARETNGLTPKSVSIVRVRCCSSGAAPADLPPVAGLLLVFRSGPDSSYRGSRTQRFSPVAGQAHRKMLGDSRETLGRRTGRGPGRDPSTHLSRGRREREREREREEWSGPKEDRLGHLMTHPGTNNNGCRTSEML